ncbi:hypothetical protein BVC93_25030 [Mycobacterium sp. MS1601]|uniref:Rv1733c family protein n=1 Tax=Mycobacterium sp. MS1601 TaxID=1936029 RepID=UPI0009794CAF|nr:hypothetical protein [Mycobacterium sp. MS1601]AQA05124.1 hypothetical protein BVC93_25030 [Mycobacterium sp. MS1601]
MDTVHFTVKNTLLLRACGRNPLVRNSDRVEAISTLFLVAILVLFVPVAGAIGTAVHDSQTTYRTDALATRQERSALVTDNSVNVTAPSDTGSLTPVRWSVGDEIHEDVVRSKEWYQRGDEMTIWVDHRGVRVPAPPTPADAALAAVMAAVATWLGVAAAAALGRAMMQRRLDHKRYTEWDNELHQLADGDGKHPRHT